MFIHMVIIHVTVLDEVKARHIFLWGLLIREISNNGIISHAKYSSCMNDTLLTRLLHQSALINCVHTKQM